MKAFIDAEVYLYPAIVTAQYEVEFQPDMWTYICNHSDAKTAFDRDGAKVKDVLPDAEVVLVFGEPCPCLHIRRYPNRMQKN